MQLTIDYKDETRQQIIAEQLAKGLRLVEDQRYLDGNHLIFTDEPYIEEPPTVAEELAALNIDAMSDAEAKQKLKAIKAKSALEG